MVGFSIFQRGINGLSRLTEYSDDTLCRSKRSIDFGPSLPNVGEGSGVRGLAHSWRSSQCFRSSSRAEFWELIYQGGIPLTPQPLSRAGAKPMLAIVPFHIHIQLVEVSL